MDIMAFIVNRMGVREAGMLWMKALFVVLFVVVILTINFK
jgi:hypothetical protein